MTQQEITFWLSIFGAVISFVLACIKIFEFVSARRVRLKPDANLTSSDDIGSTITLVNASSVPVHIGYHDLAWVQPYKLFGWNVPWLGKVTDEITTIEPWDAEVETIPPHNSISFRYVHEFNPFGEGQVPHRRLYLRLYVVADGTMWVRIRDSEAWN